MRTFTRVTVVVVALCCGTPSQAQLVFPDGTEQESAGIVFTHTFVSPANGTDAENGAALEELVEVTISALVLPAGEPFRVRVLLDAGRYDLTGTTLTLPSNVELHGAGTGNTLLFGDRPVIEMDGDDCKASGLTIFGVAKASPIIAVAGLRAELRDVAVQHDNAPIGVSVGVEVSSGSLEARGVEVTMLAAGDENVGLAAVNTGVLEAFDCDINVGGATVLNTGVLVADDGSAVLRNCRVEAAGTLSRGIWLGYGADSTVANPTLTVYHSEIRGETLSLDAEAGNFTQAFVGAFRYTHFFGSLNAAHLSFFLYCALNGSPLADDPGGDA